MVLRHTLPLGCCFFVFETGSHVAQATSFVAKDSLDLLILLPRVHECLITGIQYSPSLFCVQHGGCPLALGGVALQQETATIYPLPTPEGSLLTSLRNFYSNCTEEETEIQGN